ncbi:MAG TPA: Nif3-like dinuclear metal center hexameric protein [Pirellulales bacterium]|jgi:dinuclear metal center YbgI/SA1388 family protein|nr:Nif3-like dinuclear metal center hexameric protein [Pirellulales bacterium]
MPTIDDLAKFLEAFAPPRLAESWDNVGLLVGDRAARVERVMTCLTVTPASAAEAIDARAELIVTHHPLPFRPLKRIATDEPTGELLWRLIGAGVSIYSPHTAFDSAASGINQRWAEGLELRDIVPLVASPTSARGGIEGAGRCGTLPHKRTLAEVAERVKRLVGIDRVQVVGAAACGVRRLAIACGSGGEFVEAAHRLGCDCLVTGEARFHTCLEAEALGMALILAGHFASERFAVAYLAEVIEAQWPELEVWPSRRERDPLAWL